MTYFTADTHLGHENILKLGKGRPFATIQDHDDAIIQNTIKTLRPGDTLVHLGDVAWHKEVLHHYLETLCSYHIRLFWLMGNHDYRFDIEPVIAGFPNLDHYIKDVTWFELEGAPTGGVWLSHYPHRSWPKSFHGSGHLHGHVHGGLLNRHDVTGLRRTIDVGVDLWNLHPVPEHTIISLLNQMPHFIQEGTV